MNESKFPTLQFHFVNVKMQNSVKSTFSLIFTKYFEIAVNFCFFHTAMEVKILYVIIHCQIYIGKYDAHSLLIKSAIFPMPLSMFLLFYWEEHVQGEHWRHNYKGS